MSQLHLFEEISSQSPLSLQLNIDGVARNNPGPAGAGICIFKDDQLLEAHGFYLGALTNNEAEYSALVIGLALIAKLVSRGDRIVVVSDSELLIRQLTGVYRVKKKELLHLYNRAQALVEELRQRGVKDITFRHVPRDENRCADKWANKGVDGRIPLPVDFHW
ncbi:MAG: ribonuclease HI family protein [Candidatus Babeliaceae bacterium]|nr:ribonuclease HI family protein [Candidatus Babeliaceae bacterium]